MATKFSLTNFPFDRTDPTKEGFRVSKEEGWYSAPPTSPTISDRPGADGGVDGPSWRRPRAVTLTGLGVWRTRAAALVAARAFAAVNKDLGTLTVEDALGVLSAKVRLGAAPGVEWVSPFSFKWDLNLLAPDYRKYAPEILSTTALPIDPPLGFDFDDGSGLDFGATPNVGTTDAGEAPSLGSAPVANDGTAPHDPVIRLSGGSTGLTGPITVTDGRTGRRLRYLGNIPAGDYVVLDSYDRSVLYNGTVNRRDLLDMAQWFDLPAGAMSSVAWSHSGGASIGAQMTVSIRPAYF